jgi:hypothetical protein
MNEERSPTNAATTSATTTATRSRYSGPTAARIADLIAQRQRVRFERGWFWTAAVCHESEQDTLAFRQRPDGDGIDVRCKSAGCRRERIIRRLETLGGEPIWSAYTAEADPPQAVASESGVTAKPVSGVNVKPVLGVRPKRDWRALLAPFVLLLLAAPLALGYDLQVVALNAFGLGWTAWLVRRVVLNQRLALGKAVRRR